MSQSCKPSSDAPPVPLERPIFVVAPAHPRPDARHRSPENAMMRTPLVLLAALLATSGMRAERASLLDADRAHAAATAGGLAAGFAGVLAPDAVLLWPTLPIARGRDSVVALLGRLPGAAHRSMTWHAVRADVSSDGTKGYTAGYGERTGPVSPDSARLATTPMRYAAFWTKNAAGAWQVEAWVLVAGDTGSRATAPRGCESPSYDSYVRFPVRDIE